MQKHPYILTPGIYRRAFRTSQGCRIPPHMTRLCNDVVPLLRLPHAIRLNAVTDCRRLFPSGCLGPLSLKSRKRFQSWKWSGPSDPPALSLLITPPLVSVRSVVATKQHRHTPPSLSAISPRPQPTTFESQIPGKRKKNESDNGQNWHPNFAPAEVVKGRPQAKSAKAHPS